MKKSVCVFFGLLLGLQVLAQAEDNFVCSPDKFKKIAVAKGDIERWEFNSCGKKYTIRKAETGKWHFFAPDVSFSQALSGFVSREDIILYACAYSSGDCDQHKKQQELAEAQRKEQQYQATLNGKSPRTIYILGTQMEDQGDESRAKECYRKVVSAFPDSDFAIKASDRLTRMRDVSNIADSARESANRIRQESERAQEGARNQNNQNRSAQNRACESRISTCRSSCRFTDDACYRQCTTICSIVN